MSSFKAALHWRGSTLPEDYNRNTVASAPGKHGIHASSGPGFGGDAARWNPEDLFGAALAQCHLLTFLALAHKVKLDVLTYDDDVTVELVTEGRTSRIGRVTLAPTIGVAPGTDADLVRTMFEKAHKYCFVANSTTAEVVMTPTVVTRG
jgi:organic hydroperoxide reductase OsmC/OhrA